MTMDSNILKTLSVEEKRRWLVDTLFELFRQATSGQMESRDAKEIISSATQLLAALKQASDPELKEEGAPSQALSFGDGDMSADGIAREISEVYRRMQTGDMAHERALERLEFLSLMLRTLKDLPKTSESGDDTILNQEIKAGLESIEAKVQASMRHVDAWHNMLVRARTQNVINPSQIEWMTADVAKLMNYSHGSQEFANEIHEMYAKQASDRANDLAKTHKLSKQPKPPQH